MGCSTICHLGSSCVLASYFFSKRRRGPESHHFTAGSHVVSLSRKTIRYLYKLKKITFSTRVQEQFLSLILKGPMSRFSRYGVTNIAGKQTRSFAIEEKKQKPVKIKSSTIIVQSSKGLIFFYDTGRHFLIPKRANVYNLI